MSSQLKQLGNEALAEELRAIYRDYRRSPRQPDEFTATEFIGMIGEDITVQRAVVILKDLIKSGKADSRVFKKQTLYRLTKNERQEDGNQ